MKVVVARKALPPVDQSMDADYLVFMGAEESEESGPEELKYGTTGLAENPAWILISRLGLDLALTCNPGNDSLQRGHPGKQVATVIMGRRLPFPSPLLPKYVLYL